MDNSKVGWPAAVGYEKMNGMVIKAESDKFWVEAEKAISDQKRKERSQPFRDAPAEAGKDQYYSRSTRGWCLTGSLVSMLLYLTLSPFYFFVT